jgi:ribosomal protein L24E
MGLRRKDYFTTKCALACCNKPFDVSGWGEYPNKLRINRDTTVYFCSDKCEQGYYEWCAWQKDLGNGIESSPPDYGGQITYFLNAKTKPLLIQKINNKKVHYQ